MTARAKWALSLQRVSSADFVLLFFKLETLSRSVVMIDAVYAMRHTLRRYTSSSGIGTRGAQRRLVCHKSEWETLTEPFLLTN